MVSFVPTIKDAGTVLVCSFIVSLKSRPASGLFVPIPTSPADVIRTLSLPPVQNARVSAAALNIPVFWSPTKPYETKFELLAAGNIDAKPVVDPF